MWQHSSCLGIKKEDAEKDDFHFVCSDCKRKEEEANRPKLPPLKFRVSSTPSPSTVGVKPKMEEHGRVPPSPVKHTHDALSKAQNGPSQQGPQPTLPLLTAQRSQFAQAQHQFYVPPSPQRLPRPADQSLPSSSPPRPPFSPSKPSSGPSQPFAHQQTHFGPGPGQHILPPMQPGPHLPPIGSFQSPRPSSSHSGYGPTQNHPSMSPTQGNHDVGPLAGVPSAAPTNGSGPWSSFESYATPRPQSGHGGTPAMSAHYPSFSSAATPNGHHSSPPHSSHGMSMSGISPTKQSPRPITAGGMAGAPVLPPIRRLEPSPKLMGRSSPDAPIPAPMKCMTNEQEERRQRENASLLNNGQSFSANGQPHLMSSPSMSRIPPLGPAAHSQLPEPVPSPQNGGHAARQ